MVGAPLFVRERGTGERPLADEGVGVIPEGRSGFCGCSLAALATSWNPMAGYARLRETKLARRFTPFHLDCKPQPQTEAKSASLNTIHNMRLQEQY